MIVRNDEQDSLLRGGGRGAGNLGPSGGGASTLGMMAGAGRASHMGHT